MSNEWFYTSPKDEIFTVLCGNHKSQMKLQGRGKLYLPSRCKGYSTHSTLYAISTITRNNSQEDVLPLAPVDLDCCLTLPEKEQLNEISLNRPLTNILSSVEDLKVASIKIDEIQELINEEEKKRFERFSLSLTTWCSVTITIVIFIICIGCSCCCCKCCRRIGFWMWDRWTPRECLRHSKEHCCIVNNFSADRISYTEVPSIEPLKSPPGSPKSAHSLPVSFKTYNVSKQLDPEPTRRRSLKLFESLEMDDLKAKPKLRERKGERLRLERYVPIFFPQGEV
jgi:hypothetical protein